MVRESLCKDHQGNPKEQTNAQAETTEEVQEEAKDQTIDQGAGNDSDANFTQPISWKTGHNNAKISDQLNTTMYFEDHVIGNIQQWFYPAVWTKKLRDFFRRSYKCGVYSAWSHTHCDINVTNLVPYVQEESSDHTRTSSSRTSSLWLESVDFNKSNCGGHTAWIGNERINLDDINYSNSVDQKKYYKLKIEDHLVSLASKDDHEREMDDFFPNGGSSDIFRTRLSTGVYGEEEVSEWVQFRGLKGAIFQRIFKFQDFKSLPATFLKSKPHGPLFVPCVEDYQNDENIKLDEMHMYSHSSLGTKYLHYQDASIKNEPLVNCFLANKRLTNDIQPIGKLRDSGLKMVHQEVLHEQLSSIRQRNHIKKMAESNFSINPPVPKKPMPMNPLFLWFRVKVVEKDTEDNKKEWVCSEVTDVNVSHEEFKINGNFVWNGTEDGGMGCFMKFQNQHHAKPGDGKAFEWGFSKTIFAEDRGKLWVRLPMRPWWIVKIDCNNELWEGDTLTKPQGATKFPSKLFQFDYESSLNPGNWTSNEYLIRPGMWGHERNYQLFAKKLNQAPKELTLNGYIEAEANYDAGIQFYGNTDTALSTRKIGYMQKKDKFKEGDFTDTRGGELTTSPYNNGGHNLYIPPTRIQRLDVMRTDNQSDPTQGLDNDNEPTVKPGNPFIVLNL